MNEAEFSRQAENLKEKSGKSRSFRGGMKA